MLTRPPTPALRPFVKTLWASDLGDATAQAAQRERVLPTGTMSVAFLLGQPLRLYRDEADAEGHVIGRAVVGGARDTFYLKDISRPQASVGAQLQPGAAELLLGVPAGELAGRHTALDDLWGRDASIALEQFADAPSPAARVDRLEALLLSRLPRVRGLRPAVAEALARLSAEPTTEVGDVVASSGFSHRHFIALFRDAVGLAPKAYARVARFQAALKRLGAPAPRMIDVALDAGYADQPHYNRDFRAIAGVSPRGYRRASPVYENHVPVLGWDRDDVKS